MHAVNFGIFELNYKGTMSIYSGLYRTYTCMNVYVARSRIYIGTAIGGHVYIGLLISLAARPPGRASVARGTVET